MHAEMSQPSLHCTIPNMNTVGALQHVASHLASRPRKHASVVETAPLIIALLMDQPRTARDLASAIDAHISSVKRWLTAFEAAGVLTYDSDGRHANRYGCGRIWRMHWPESAS